MKPEKTIATYQTVPHLPAGLKYQEIPGDGHCLFNAIGLYIGETPISLRHMVSDHMEENIDEYQAFYEGTKEELEEHIKAIRESNEWGDNLEIEAVQRATGRPIIIIRPEQAAIIPELTKYQSPPIFIYYNGHNHYDAALLRDDADVQNIIEDLRNTNTEQKPAFEPEEAQDKRHVLIKETWKNQSSNIEKTLHAASKKTQKEVCEAITEFLEQGGKANFTIFIKKKACFETLKKAHGGTSFLRDIKNFSTKIKKKTEQSNKDKKQEESVSLKPVVSNKKPEVKKEKPSSSGMACFNKKGRGSVIVQVAKPTLSPLGFIAVIPIPLKDYNAYRFGKDRSPLVLARKYIKAINFINPEYVYEKGQGITLEMLQFARQHLRIFFVMNRKETPSEAASQVQDIYRADLKALFNHLKYPVSLEIAYWDKDEESKLGKFPFMTMRALIFNEKSRHYQKIKKFEARFKQCLVLSGDADLVSLHTNHMKTRTIFNVLQQKHAQENKAMQANIIRYLGAYQFRADEIFLHLDSKGIKNTLLLMKGCMMTILYNCLDTLTRHILSQINPNLAYFSEANTAYNMRLVEQGVARVLDDKSKPEGDDWAHILNKLSSKAENASQAFMKEASIFTSSKNDIVTPDKINLPPHVLCGSRHLPNMQLRAGQLNERFKEAGYGANTYKLLMRHILETCNSHLLTKNKRSKEMARIIRQYFLDEKTLEATDELSSKEEPYTTETFNKDLETLKSEGCASLKIMEDPFYNEHYNHTLKTWENRKKAGGGFSLPKTRDKDKGNSYVSVKPKFKSKVEGKNIFLALYHLIELVSKFENIFRKIKRKTYLPNNVEQSQDKSMIELLLSKAKKKQQETIKLTKSTGEAQTHFFKRSQALVAQFSEEKLLPNGDRSPLFTGEKQSFFSVGEPQTNREAPLSPYKDSSRKPSKKVG